MMNAGASYCHEERVLEEGGALEGLQIFIRPETPGLKPQVPFYQLPEVHSTNLWRKIAGKGSDYPLQIRSNTWLMDVRLEEGQQIVLPEAPSENCAFLFYIFAGKVNVNETMGLVTGESALAEDDNPLFRAVETSDIYCLSQKQMPSILSRECTAATCSSLVINSSIFFHSADDAFSVNEAPISYCIGEFFKRIAVVCNTVLDGNRRSA